MQVMVFPHGDAMAFSADQIVWFEPPGSYHRPLDSGALQYKARELKRAV